MWVFGGQDKVRSLWCHERSDLRYQQQRPKQVVDAKDDFNMMFDDELRDAVVLACANTSSPFTATRSGKKWSSGHKDMNLWLGYADGAGRRQCHHRSQRASLVTSGAGLGQADLGCGSGRVFGKVSGGGGFPPPAQ